MLFIIIKLDVLNVFIVIDNIDISHSDFTSKGVEQKQKKNMNFGTFIHRFDFDVQQHIRERD